MHRRPAFLISLALGLALLVGVALLWSSAPWSSSPPPVYAQLPAFDLVDQDGRPFDLDRLRGRVCVVNFIFTSCTSVCPRLTSLMYDVQTELAGQDGIQLVSVSVDPVRDTPPRLRQYGQQFGADFSRWSFLTGPLEDIEQTVRQGFLMTMQKGEPDDAGFFDIVHGERFVLVDRQARIRGYFDADPAGMTQLLRTARRLLEEPAATSAPPAAVVSRSR